MHKSLLFAWKSLHGYQHPLNLLWNTELISISLHLTLQNRISIAKIRGSSVLWKMSQHAHTLVNGRLNPATTVWILLGSFFINFGFQKLDCSYVFRFESLFPTENLVGTHDAPIRCVEYCPEVNVMVTGSWDQTVKLWDPRTPCNAGTFSQPEKVCT